MRQRAFDGVTIGTIEHKRLLLGFAALLGVVLLLLLGIYNQPYHPNPWLDEGFVLQGSINLVRFGQYAMKSVEGFRVLDQPLIANGPGVVLPISAIFALFGVGLLQARLLMVGYLIVTALVFFAVAKRLYGTLAAVVSLFLLLAVPREGFLLYGRHALGNVPALGYFLIGYLLWLSSIERDGWGYSVAAGLMFGLAMVTKGQYGLLIPILLLVALADLLYYRTIGLRKIATVLLVAIGCLAIWNGVQLMLVGLENYSQHLDAVRGSSHVTVFSLRPERIPGSLWYLVRSGLPLFLAPGLLYAAWSCRKPNLHSCRQILLVVFVFTWLFWYAFVSVGWHRYAFAPYAVGLIFAGKFVIDAISYLRGEHSILASRKKLQIGIRLGALVLVTAMVVGGVWGFTQQVKSIFANPDTSFHRFAEYLQDNVSSLAVVESWEWEIDALTDLTYHHPTNDWVDKFTAVLQFGDDLEASYDMLEHQPDYLIDGPMSKWTGLYAPYLDEGCCNLIFSSGQYDLYEVNIQAAATY